MSHNLSAYNTQIDLKIDWSELNLFGHVSNVEFFNYIQASRINYLDAVGFSHTHGNQSTGSILASASCQFKQPLFYPGNVRVLAKVDFIKNTSFGMTHLILDEKNQIAAIGQDIIVMFDYNANQKIMIPADIRNSIQKKEGRIFEKTKL